MSANIATLSGHNGAGRHSVERSAVEVAVLVIAGLIDGCERRAEAMAPLTAAVTTAVDELDPNHERDTSPTWWHDMDRWRRLDALDRLRLAHDSLYLLEEQAAEIALGLRAMLAPHPATFSYRDDHGRLCRMAEKRAVHIERLKLAEKRLRPRLLPATSAQLRQSRRVLIAEENRGGVQLARLSALLSMADQVMAS